jgi:hypothetical protein
MRAALFSYVRERDVLCCRVGGRPDDPCSDPTIMAYLVPNSSGFEGRRAADGWMPLGRLGGVADVGPYGAQWQVRRRPVPVRSAALGCRHSAQRGFVRAGAAAMPLTVAGMVSHRPSAFT